MHKGITTLIFNVRFHPLRIMVEGDYLISTI